MLDHVRTFATLVAAVMAFASCATAEPLPAAVQSRLEAASQAAFDREPTAGLAVGVYRGNEVLLERGWGVAVVDSRTPVTPQTVFHVGSITKPFTGLAINQLIASGLISPADTVGELLPGYVGPARDVAVAQLLTHTAGVPEYVTSEVVGDFGPYTREKVLALFRDRPLVFAPGTRWLYSNSDTYLLGLIIEAVSRLSYADYVEQRIAGPFGLEHTYFAGRAPAGEPLAAGYFRTPGGPVVAPEYDPLLPFSAGSMLSTIGDLRRFARAAYGPAGVAKVAPDVRQALLSPVRLPGGEEVFYRLGSVAVLDMAGHKKVGHAGLTAGFTSYFAYYPDDDLTIVVLSNATGVAPHPAHLEAELARIVLNLPAPAILDRPIDPQAAQTFAGNYAMGPFTFFGTDVFSFSARDGGLYFQFSPPDPDAPAIRLLQQGNDEFVSEADSEHVFIFRRNDAGRVTGFDLSFYGMPFRGLRQ
ncbi:MAG: serine hydrolase domain-containing protein [Caulobacter sp.]|nr:serine hydrolase domain-containing protein [Caulobacter sp.]